MAEDMGDKTELPTGRRRQEARDQGQVARSGEFLAGADLIVSFILVLTLGSTLAGGLAAIMRHQLDDRLSGSSISIEAIERVLEWTLVHGLLMVAPVAVIMLVVVFLLEYYQVGWHLSTTALTPNLARLNPVSGFMRLFQKQNLIRSGLGLVKVTVATLVVVLVVLSEWEHILALAALDFRPMLSEIVRILTRVCVWLLVLIMVLGLMDLVLQRWQLTQRLKMTKQEVKDEFKMMDGDPEIKGRRMRVARQLSLQRIRSAVPKADVIVTNPTHFAVALQYDPASMTAPRVVAKGADYLAFRIREVAAAHNIPIVERPPLARALYAGVPVGKTINAEFFEAVAEILAYVYRLNGKAA
jgi:flagellar biosynthesis protein FlhB